MIGFAQWAHQAFHAHQITDYPSRKDQAGRREPLGLIRAAVAARTTTILNSGSAAPWSWPSQVLFPPPSACR